MGINNKNEWLEKKYKNTKERKDRFCTLSGYDVQPLYTSEDITSFNDIKDLGFPGEFPYTRGVQTNMYRGRLWTMRQFAGFGTASDTNKRFKYLLSQGQTGLSTAFDMPTIMGYDSDHPRSYGEVGRLGVAIDTVEDMNILFQDIPLDKVSTSMTINAPASILLAFYIVVGERQGIDSKLLRGTIQNDILKEYIAQKSWIFPPEPSLRIITDIMAYCKDNVPKWNTISISGYHIREAGANAVQELAFTLANGFTYVEAGIKAGLNVDDFAPRLSFFFNAHNDFFEEIAKYRTARRIWAREMKERFKAKNPDSWKLRFHTQTAGCSLTAQQPENNIIRTAYQAMAAVLGGTQSLHTNSMDEVLALPTEKAVRIALRTQHILAHETGVTNTIDPLAGSYFIESLTNKIEEEVYNYFKKIEELGGVVSAIEKNFFQQEIADSAAIYQKEIEKKERIIVGVNDYKEGNEDSQIELLKISPKVEKEQIERLRKVKSERSQTEVERCLKNLKQAALGTDNLMYPILDAARNRVSEGEIIDVFREVFGEYKEKPIF